MMTTVNKRKMRRFALQIPACLRVDDEGTVSPSNDYVTKDISSEGAFITTSKPLPLGTRIIAQFFISNQFETDQQTTVTRLETTGKIIRNSMEGMAVLFDRQCQIFGV